MAGYARDIGGPALAGRLTSLTVAKMAQRLSRYTWNDHKTSLYDVSSTRAYAVDHLDRRGGGIGTMQLWPPKGRREMPDDQSILDGPVEQLGPHRSVHWGANICTPLAKGVAVASSTPSTSPFGRGHVGKARPDAARRCARYRQTATATCQVTRSLFPPDDSVRQFMPDGRRSNWTGAGRYCWTTSIFRMCVSFTGQPKRP